MAVNMRFYESADVNFYINKRVGWDQYCRYDWYKSWASKSRQLSAPRFMYNYRDIEGKYKVIIEDKDLLFKDWPKSRKAQACLPIYYANGTRFIKLVQAPPCGFKCAHATMNLREVQQKDIEIKLQKEEAARKAAWAKLLLQQCQKKMKKR